VRRLSGSSWRHNYALADHLYYLLAAALLQAAGRDLLNALNHVGLEPNLHMLAKDVLSQNN